MSFIDYAVILLYIVAFVGIGIYVTKKNVKSAKDFATAGQGLSLGMVVGSTVATCMGASIIFGNYQLVFDSGMQGMITNVFWNVGWMFLVIMSGRMRATGASSIPMFIEKTYGKTARQIASYAVLCMGVSSTAAQFKAVGSMTAALGLCDATTGILIGAVIIVLFTVFSGLYGVALTDTIQSVMIVVTVGAIIPVTATVLAGGPAAAFNAIEPGALSLSGGGMTAGVMLGYILSNMFSCGCHPAYAQRSLAAKDNKVAVKGQLIACVLCLIITFVAAWPAFFGRTLFPNMTDGSQFIPAFIATYFPPILKGLALAILLGLLLTSGDTFLLLLSSTATEDIIRPAKPDIDEKKLLKIGRGVVVFGAIVIVCLALYIPTITDLFKIGGSAFGCCCFFPCLFGCFWKKVNKQAVTLSMLVCCPLSIIWDLFLKGVTGQSGSLIAGITSLVICVVGSLILNSKQKQTA